MEWIKKLLEKAVINEGVLDADALDKAIDKEFPSHAVPKIEFNTISTQLKEANLTISGLKKNNADNAELQETLKAHEETISTLKNNHAQEVKDWKINAAITNLLTSAKAKHPDLLSEKFDKSKVVIGNDGKVSGLEEQITGMKETYKDLFEQSISGQTPSNPDVTTGMANTYEALMKQADSMSSEEVAAQFDAMSKTQ